MKVETRIFAAGKPEEKRHLLIISESEEDSKTIDWVFGTLIPTKIKGEVTLSDGYADHYIRLEKSA